MVKAENDEMKTTCEQLKCECEELEGLNVQYEASKKESDGLRVELKDLTDIQTQFTQVHLIEYRISHVTICRFKVHYNICLALQGEDYNQIQSPRLFFTVLWLYYYYRFIVRFPM